MTHLDKKLVDTADFNSAVGMGTIINRGYLSNIDVINSLDITDDEKTNAINHLFDLTTAELMTYSNNYPSISTVGPARYNMKKGLKALDRKVAAWDAVRAFMNKLRTEQNRKESAIKQQQLVKDFQSAVQNKQKEFTSDGVEYVVRGRTRFVEKKYA